MKAVVAAFNQEKALVGAFSVIVQQVVEPMDRFAALITSPDQRFERRGPGSTPSNVAVSGTRTKIWENYNVILLRIIFTLPLFCPTLSEAG